MLENANGEILLGHRVKSGETPSWCLPGGHVEPGESFEKAAVRELKEETGITDVADVRAFAAILDTGEKSVRVTVGVLGSTHDALPATAEPDVFDCWQWAGPHHPPTPLFPATAHLLARWLGCSAASGSTTASYLLEATPLEGEPHD